jgi:hypothetical protein
MPERVLGQASEQLGETDIALDALTTATRLSGGNSKPLGLRGYILAKIGQIRPAREMLTMLDELSRTRYVPPYAPALIYAGLEEDQKVFDALEHAYASRDVHLVFLHGRSQMGPLSSPASLRSSASTVWV